MIIQAKKNSVYQFVGMLLQFNFPVSVSRSTLGDDVIDILQVKSIKYNTNTQMSVYGSVDDGGTFILPNKEIKSELCDAMAVVNYSDGTITIYNVNFFLSNIPALVKDGAVYEKDGVWFIYPKAVSGLFKLHEPEQGGGSYLWESEGRMVYYMQRVEINYNKNSYI